MKITTQGIGCAEEAQGSTPRIFTFFPLFFFDVWTWSWGLLYVFSVSKISELQKTPKIIPYKHSKNMAEPRKQLYAEYYWKKKKKRKKEKEKNEKKKKTRKNIKRILRHKRYMKTNVSGLLSQKRNSQGFKKASKINSAQQRPDGLVFEQINNRTQYAGAPKKARGSTPLSLVEISKQGFESHQQRAWRRPGVRLPYFFLGKCFLLCECRLLFMAIYWGTHLLRFISSPIPSRWCCLQAENLHNQILKTKIYLAKKYK